VKGGIWRNAGAGAPLTNLDPQLSAVSSGPAALIGDPLIQMSNVTRALRGSVIEKWEQPQPTTLILHVRQGVKFHNKPPANARTLEARDIVYMIRSLTGSLYPNSPIPFPNKGRYTSAKDPVAVDALTVRIDFTTPRSDFLYTLADDTSWPVPEGLRESFGGIDSLITLRPDRAIATGPFILDQYEPGGTSVYKRNPDYWDQPYPYVDTHQSTSVADNTTAITALISGQNMYVERISDADLDLAKRGLSDVKVEKPPLPAFRRVALNTRIKPYDDPRVRQALALCFDRPAFGAAIQGKDSWRYPGPLPFHFPEAIPQDDLAKLPGMRSPTDADVAQARSLLSAAGLGNGFSADLVVASDITGVSAYKAAAEHFKAQVEKLLPGVKINLNPSTYSGVLAVLPKTDQWQMATIGGNPEISPVNQMFLFLHSKGTQNWSGFNDPKMDNLIESAFSELDTTKRTQLLRDAQNEALAQWPEVMTHLGLSTTIVHPSVRNLETGGNFFAGHSERYAWLVKS
jgi:peptide/nickel transport system substrate-binding protein